VEPPQTHDLPEPLRTMLRVDGGSALDADGRVGADLPPRLRTALLADTRDVLGADGRIAIDLPCLGCGYNQRTLRADGRCPECGHEVAATVRERGEPAAVRLWVEDVSAGLRVLSWSTMCVAVACIGRPWRVRARGTSGVDGVPVSRDRRRCRYRPAATRGAGAA
jgi:hypothetical protein